MTWGRLGMSLGCMLVLAIAGCGAQPSPVSPKRPSAPPVSPIGIPGYGQNAPQTGDRGPVILAEMGRAVGQLRSASYQGVMYCRGKYGNRPKGLSALPNGEWEATSHYRVDYQRPEAYRIEVTRCTNPNSVGMKMVVRQDRARVKVPGLLGLVPLSFDLGDRMMKNFRGHRLDVGSLSGLAERFSHAPDARWVGEMAVGAQMVDLVEIPRTPDFDAAVVKEIVGVDRQHRLPLVHAMFTAERMVYEMKIPTIRLNASVSEDFDDL